MERSAMTVGFAILSATLLEGRLLAHERHHVPQYMVWGPTFIPRYFFARDPVRLPSLSYGTRGDPRGD